MKSTTQRRGFNSATSCMVAAWQWLTFHASLPLTSTTSSWAQSRDTGATPWCSSEPWSPSQPRGWKWINHLTVLLRITSLCGRWWFLCSAAHFKITAGLHPSLSKTHATGCESKGPSQMVPSHHLGGCGFTEVFLSSKAIPVWSGSQLLLIPGCHNIHRIALI